MQGYVDFVPFLSSPSACTTANLPPDLGAIVGPSVPILINSSVVAGANFNDPNPADVHVATWNWGDGSTTTGIVSEAGGSGTVAGAHTYTTLGVYTITLTVIDPFGASDESQFQYVVVYDPNGGFVTGGGWINSPPGAFTATPSLTGKANFGFVSKYQNGASVPTGDTEFQFKAGNLNFKSTSYDWLVVAGAKAKYKGSGTINGAGDYAFQLSATDGQVNGGGGVDKFRIKITSKSGGGVIYDNQMGNPDTADASTAIAGGSIVVHK